MSFIIVSSCGSCGETPKPNNDLSTAEKFALGADAFAVVVTAMAAAAVYFYGSPQIQLVSYCLWGGAVAVALVETVYITCALLREPSKTDPIPTSTDPLSSLLVPYNEEPLETVARPSRTVEALNQFDKDKRQDIRQQGASLDRDFYYQRIRGNGDCFYLAYVSGLLHALVASKDFDSIRGRLTQVTDSHEALKELAVPLMGVLQELQDSPTHQKLYEILEDPKRVAPLLMFLRHFAIYHVLHLQERSVDTPEAGVQYVACPIGYASEGFELLRHVWNEESLFGIDDIGQAVGGGILQNNPELAKKMGPPKRENYCSYQIGEGVDAQRPEMGMLNDYLFPFRLYQRLDNAGMQPSERENNGLIRQYSQDSPLVLFGCPNHFDCLIPKQG